MGIAELAVTLIFGVPIIGGLFIAFVCIIKSWVIKNQQMKLEAEKLKVEGNLRQAQLTDQLLHADDYTATIAEIRLLAAEVRQLRTELEQMRQTPKSDE